MKESTRRRLELVGVLTPREDRWRVPALRESLTLTVVLGALSALTSRLVEKLGYARSALLFVPLALVAGMLITALNRWLRRATSAERSARDSKWFFQRGDFPVFTVLLVLPLVAIVVTPYVFDGWAARVVWGAGSLVLLGVIGRRASMGVTISGESVTVTNFSGKTRLRADEIERFEPPERSPTGERPARVVLKDGTTIPIRALQPRRGTRLTGERSIREQIAKMNWLLGEPQD